jgi:hypothetical protein
MNTEKQEWDELCLEMRDALKSEVPTRAPRTAESAEIARQTAEYLAAGNEIEQLPAGESQAWQPRFDAGAYLEHG